jgi:DmsE family decaheme c-type cytochrome
MRGAMAAAAAIVFRLSAPAAPPASLPAGYAGSETCMTCHEDLHSALKKNPHQAVETDSKRGFAKRACEACHGPGAKHAESATAADIVNPARLKPAEADRLCMKCHLNQPTHMGRLQSGHAKNATSCTSCHVMHKGPEKLVARKPAAVNRQCAGCHAAVWARLQKPFHHKLPEGVMSCVDCHNPHGSLAPKSLQLARNNEPGCLKCHGDKAGPFPFEHPVVKLEGCGACHEPHGSANPHQLTRHEVRYVCLECHSNLPLPATQPATALGTVPPAIHDMRSPRYANCTLCHQKIHGSYVNGAFMR